MIKDIKAKNENAKPNKRILEKLRTDFPECFSKGKFDIERFQQMVQEEVDVTREGYDLNFLGKNYANLIASTETETVIQPDNKHNALPENQNSQNIYISGDNLDALKHLLKSYSGKIKCIYIDPPYNTGTDGFVYNDRFDFTSEQLQIKLGISEEKADRILDLARRGSASHSAWLMFMAPRLMLAKDLLTEDGVIFISIDDNEQANLKLLCDSILGEENFVATFPWRKRTAKSDVPFGVSQDYEWIVCYAKTGLSQACIDGKERKYYETDDFPNKPWRIHDMTTQKTATERPNCFFTITNPKNGEQFPPNPNRVWANNEDTFKEYYAANRIVFPGDYNFLNISKPVLRYWKEDDEQKAGDTFGKVAVSTNLPNSVGMSQDGTKDIDELFSSKIFSYPKPVSLLKYILSTITDNNDIILDFFSGSATTAHAVMKLNSEDDGNRKYIMVQIPEQTPKDKEARKAGYETIDQIGQERIRRAAKKIREQNSLFADGHDLGFKHYTLQDIPKDTLDKMETFDPNGLYGEEDILNKFGKETILETWCVKDGYGLGADTKELPLANYSACHCGSHLYFIESENFDEKAMIALIDLYHCNPAFNPQNIVLFGYSFNFTQVEMLKKNLAILSNKNLEINLDIRY